MTMDMTVFADGFADPERGSAGTWALLIAGLVCFGIFRFDLWWRNRKGGGDSPGELPAPDEVPREKHATVDTVRPSRLRQLARQTGHVMRTGTSLPDGEVEELDVPPPSTRVEAYVPRPAGGPDDDDFGFLFSDDPDPDAEEAERYVPAGKEVKQRETAESYAARCLRRGFSRQEIVEALADHYGTPRSTAYRLLNRLSGNRAA